MFIPLIAGCSFVLGLVAGFGLSTILSLILWAAVWLAVGTVAVLAIDACMGLGRRACALRARLRGWLRLRKRSHLHVVVPLNS